jgi:hypothetical protein
MLTFKLNFKAIGYPIDPLARYTPSHFADSPGTAAKCLLTKKGEGREDFHSTAASAR